LNLSSFIFFNFKKILYFFPINIFQEESNMTKEQEPPLKRILGDYVMYQGTRHFSSIAILATAKA